MKTVSTLNKFLIIAEYIKTNIHVKYKYIFLHDSITYKSLELYKTYFTMYKIWLHINADEHCTLAFVVSS